MVFKIEDGHPIPPVGRYSLTGRKPHRLGGIRKWPWHELEIGESFVMDFPRTSVAVRACNMGKRTGKQFSVSVAGDEPGFRVTRVA